MRLRLLCLGGLTLAGCQVPVTLDFPVGPLSYEVSTEDLMLPTELRSADGATLVSVPCTDQCDLAIEGNPLDMSCVEQLCDPEPFCYALDLPPVDLGDWEDLSKLGSHVTEAEVRRVLYVVEENTLNVDLPSIRVDWGPETAASLDDATVLPLGTVPAIAQAATPNGEVPLDATGAAALGQHFVDTSTIFRLFAETAIDLEPGQALPQGTLKFSCTVEVHLEGEGGL